MAQAGIISLPTLRGSIVTVGQGQSLFARDGYQIYPYQLGCAVRLDSTGVTVYASGQGEFAVNDYFIVCKKTNYGDSFLYIPDASKVGKISAVSGTEDEFTIATAMTIDAGDWLINLGADGAADPTSGPDYDGSLVQLYTDPVGNSQDSNMYVLTGQGGNFSGWIEEGYELVDLLIFTPGGSLSFALPSFQPGPGVG